MPTLRCHACRGAGTAPRPADAYDIGTFGGPCPSCGGTGETIEIRSLQWAHVPVAIVDIESTGLDPIVDHVVELAVVIGRRGEVTHRQSWLVNPGMPIPAEASAVHGITDALVADLPGFADVAIELGAVLEGCLVGAYNARFDRAFIAAEWLRTGMSAPQWLLEGFPWIDPLTWIRVTQRYERSKKLVDVCRRLGITLEGAHRATADAEAALRVLWRLDGLPDTFGDLIEQQRFHAAQDQASYQEWLRKQPAERRARG